MTSRLQWVNHKGQGIQFPSQLSCFHDALQARIWNCLLSAVQCCQNGWKLVWYSWVPLYFKRSRSIPWLPTIWPHKGPGHQQPWYWLWRINRSLFSMRKYFDYLYHLSVDRMLQYNTILHRTGHWWSHKTDQRFDGSLSPHIHPWYCQCKIDGSSMHTEGF